MAIVSDEFTVVDLIPDSSFQVIQYQEQSNVFLVLVKSQREEEESVDSGEPMKYGLMCRAHWLRSRASDSRLREPWFESCAAVLKPWESYFTLHCSSSLSCINEYLAIDSGGYVYEQPSRINWSIWLDASQRRRDGV